MSLQMPLWEPASTWVPPRLEDLPDWGAAKRIGYDVETKDKKLKQLGCGSLRKGSKLVGVGFSIEDGKDYYIPLAHEGGGNVDPEPYLRYFRDNAKRFKGDIVGANLQYDIAFSEKKDIHFGPDVTFRDIQVAAPLINELHNSYSLAKILERLGLPPKDEALLTEAAKQFGVDPKGGLYQLHSKYVGPYGEADSRLPLQALRKLELELEKQGLWKVWDMECELLPVLNRMRNRGVRISMDRLEQVEEWSLEQETEALAEVKTKTGVKVEVGDVWKPDALAPALEYLGIAVPKNSRGPSITQEFLDEIDHPVADAIKWARKTNKLRTTFTQSIRNHMINGRIHATFNQMRRDDDDGNRQGASYGRMSCANPNLQQQPSRDEFAKMFRSIYLPEEGATWASCDYSQQEPRWLTHFAEDLKLDGAKKFGDRYRKDPSTDTHDMMTGYIYGSKVQSWEGSIYKKRRFECKQIFLGKCYGQGGAKTCDILGLPTRWAVYRPRKTAVYFEDYHDAVMFANENNGRAYRAAGVEGQKILDKFDTELPFVKEIAKRAQKAAESRGYIITIGGRRCRFPQAEDGTYDWTHKALNRLIQGSSGDQTKQALINIDREGHFLQLPVHDEACSSVESEDEANRIGVLMADAIPARVPFKVDVECGPSWGESM